jgi:protease-4
MRKHPLLLGLLVFGVLLSLFLVSIWVFSFFSSHEQSLWGNEKIAIIEIKGVILDSQPVIEKLIKFRKNEKVRAIVLRIDSPGGGVGPAQEIHAEVKKVELEKKVLVSMGSVAASGGYYIACAADKIIANPGTITGSIGVIVESLNVEDLFRKIGLRSTVIKSGRHKDIGSPLRKMTAEEKRLLQGVLDSVHEQFIHAVAEGRRLPLEKVRGLADGRIFSGDQAKNLGLIDNLGDLQDTIAMAAQMAGIKGEPEVIYPEKKRFSLLDLILDETVLKLLDRAGEHFPQLFFLYTNPPGAVP